MKVLLAFIEDDVDEGLAGELKLKIEAFCRSREWHSAPEFVHETERATVAGDADIVSLGAFIELETVGSSGERASLEDAEVFVAWWGQYSRSSGKTVGFELDRDAVGWISEGDTSDLHEGVLYPWRGSLEEDGH
jgi:hypothetical protein